MPLLDAALAFSLTMLVVATVVTQLVDIIQGLAKLRRKDLHKMLGDFSTKEVVPVLDRELARLTTKAATTAIDAIKDQLPTAAQDLQKELAKADGSRIHISTKELIEHLKRTDVGKELLKQLGDNAQAVFDEVGKRYEEVGDRVTAAFRDRARLYGSLVAVALALLLNIDSVNLLKSYISNPQLRESVITQLPAIEKHVSELEKAKANPDPAAAQDQVEKLQASFTQLKTDVTDLKSSTFPIGPSQYPYFPYALKCPPSWTVGLLWFMGIVLTGALAGMGSPFWYDVVRGLTQLTQRSKDDKTP